jgi:tRNA threonylcarbamoyladenosine biosynthesis protein TsaB
MPTLAFDTGSPHLCVALLDGTKLLAEHEEPVDRRHAERLLPVIDAVLAEAGVAKRAIDRIVVGTGPGGFTSVRVGVATAKGLALALGVPVHGVGTMHAIARGVDVSGDVAVLSDARRGEVFASVYRFDGARCDVVVEPFLASDDDSVARVIAAVGELASLTCVGDARARLETHAGFRRARWAPAHDDRPKARWLAACADGTEPTDLATLEPLYVRASDAKLPPRALKTE